LKDKATWQIAIDARKKEIAEYDAKPASGEHGSDPTPRPRDLKFVFIDESYVNNNHSLGYTWYDEEHLVGPAVFMNSGKGERLVFLTAITEEDGILDLHFVNDFDHHKDQRDKALFFFFRQRNAPVTTTKT